MPLHLCLISSHQIQFPNKVFDIHYNEQKSRIIGASQNGIYQFKFQQQQISKHDVCKLDLYKQINNHSTFFQISKTLDKNNFSMKNLSTYKSTILYTCNNSLYLNQNSQIFNGSIDQLFIDKYGLFNISYLNKISLCKHNISNKHCQKNEKCNYKDSLENYLQNVGELTQLDYISNFSMKNSLLISGSYEGYVTLWDINKLKIVHQNQFFRNKVNGVNHFLNYFDCNLFIGWSSIQKRVSFHDLRTYQAVSIINNLNTDIDLHIQSTGKIVAINENNFQVIDMLSGFKRQNKINVNQNLKLKQGQNHQRLKKSRINNIVGIYHNEIQQDYFKSLKKKYLKNTIEKENIFSKYIRKDNKILKMNNSFQPGVEKQKQIKYEKHLQNKQKHSSFITCSILYQNCVILGTSKGQVLLQQISQFSSFQIANQKFKYGKKMKVSNSSISKIVYQKSGVFVLDYQGKVFFIRLQLC